MAYELDGDLKPLGSYYLGDPEKVKAAVSLPMRNRRIVQPIARLMELSPPSDRMSRSQYGPRAKTMDNVCDLQCEP